MTPARWFVGLPGLIVLAGCWGNTTSKFPEGLEPLEASTAGDPAAGVGTEELVTVHGEDDAYVWVHGRTYVREAPAAVWAAMKQPEVMANRCQSDEHSATEDNEPRYERSFVLHYFVDRIVNVSWDEQWRYGTVDGSPEAPERSIIRYQKTYGSEFIERLEGDIQLYAVDGEPGVTRIDFVEHVKAPSGADEMKGAMRDRVAAIASVVRGGPVPACP